MDIPKTGSLKRHRLQEHTCTLLYLNVTKLKCVCQLSVSLGKPQILPREWSRTDRPPLPPAKPHSGEIPSHQTQVGGTSKKKIQDVSNLPSSKSEADPKQYSITNCKRREHHVFKYLWKHFEIRKHLYIPNLNHMVALTPRLRKKKKK